MSENVVKVVSQIQFPEIPASEVVEFPRSPPPEEPKCAYEVCPICGEQVVKGTMQEHMVKCLDDF